MPTSIAVFVPREAHQAIDGIDSLEEPFGRHIGEMLAEGIAWQMTVA